MSFRDDREANLQRLDVLERELVDTKKALELALLRAAEVDDLRKSVVALTSERDMLLRGVAPHWASKNQTLRMALGVALLVLVAGGAFAFRTYRRHVADTSTRQVIAENDLEQCEAGSERLRAELGTTQAELANIDATNDDELRDLGHQLGDAVRHEAGPALIVTAHVTSRAGHVPEGAGDECAMTVRALAGGLCLATVTCGSTQVFPLEMPPDVVCTTRSGSEWSTDQVLDRAVAAIRDIPDPLLDYDARAGTLVIRETAAGGFTLRMAVRDAVPYVLR